MAIASALHTVCESSPSNKDRARESLLSTLAHPVAPSDALSRRRFGFAIMQAALITVGALGLMVGVAAAAGVDFSAVPRRVVDTLAEPLPLSAEGQQEPVGLNAGEREIAGESAASGHPADPADGRGALVAGAFVPQASPDVSGPNEANPPTQRSRTNPATGGAPDTHPQDDEGNSPGNGGHREDEGPGGDRGNQVDTSDPPGQNSGHNGQPSSDGHNGSNSSGNQGDRNQDGQTDLNGNGSNGEQPNGSNGDIPNGSNSGGQKLSTTEAPNGSNNGPSSGANGDASTKASTHH